MKKTFEEFLKEKGHDSVEKLSAEQLAGYYNEFNESKRLELEKAIESKATKEDINSLKKELEKATKEQMTALNETLKQYGVAIKALTPAEKEVSHLSFGEQLTKGLTDNLESLKQMKEGSKSASFSFETKLTAGYLHFAKILYTC